MHFSPLSRLSLYSFVSISFYSFILAFFPLYFEHLGYSAVELSWLSTGSTLATLLVPPLTLELVHRYFSARRTACILGVLTPLSYSCFFYFDAGKLSIALLLFFTVNAVKRSLDTLVETETIRRAAFAELRFEHVRVWGSIGFVAASCIVGYFVDVLGMGAIIYIGMPFLLALLGCVLTVRPLLLAKPAHSRIDTPSPSSAILSRQHQLTILATLICWASHGPFYVYFSVYLAELEWSKISISAAWSLGVIAEILFFILFPKIERQIGTLNIFKLSIIFTALRWFILSISSNSAILFSSQLLHGLSFTGVYLSSIRLISAYSSHESRERSQGYLLSLGQGAGSLLGRLGAGYLAAGIGSYLELPKVFFIASLFTLLAVAVSMFLKDASVSPD